MKLLIVAFLSLFQMAGAQSKLLEDPYLFYKNKKEYFCDQNMIAPYFGPKSPLKVEKLVINRNLDQALINAQFGQKNLTCEYQVLISLGQDYQFKSTQSIIKNLAEQEKCKEGKRWLDIIFEYGSYDFIRGNTLISLKPKSQIAFCQHEVEGLVFQLYGIQL